MKYYILWRLTRNKTKVVNRTSLLAGGYWGFHRGKPVPFANRAPSWIFEARAPGYERASAKVAHFVNSLPGPDLAARIQDGDLITNSVFSTMQPPACRLKPYAHIAKTAPVQSQGYDNNLKPHVLSTNSNLHWCWPKGARPLHHHHHHFISLKNYIFYRMGRLEWVNTVVIAWFHAVRD